LLLLGEKNDDTDKLSFQARRLELEHDKLVDGICTRGEEHRKMMKVVNHSPKICDKNDHLIDLAFNRGKNLQEACESAGDAFPLYKYHQPIWCIAGVSRKSTAYSLLLSCKLGRWAPLPLSLQKGSSRLLRTCLPWPVRSFRRSVDAQSDLPCGFAFDQTYSDNGSKKQELR
jgi:hypothetical protein